MFFSDVSQWCQTDFFPYLAFPPFFASFIYRPAHMSKFIAEVAGALLKIQPLLYFPRKRISSVLLSQHQ